MEKLKKLKVEVEEAVDQKEKVAEELDDMKKAEAKFKSQQIEINQTREKYEAEIKDQSMKQVSHTAPDGIQASMKKNP